MDRRVLIVIAIIVVIIATGMILSMKKTMKAGLARDPDATPAKTAPAKK